MPTIGVVLFESDFVCPKCKEFLYNIKKEVYVFTNPIEEGDGYQVGRTEWRSVDVVCRNCDKQKFGEVVRNMSYCVKRDSSKAPRNY